MPVAAGPGSAGHAVLPDKFVRYIQDMTRALSGTNTGHTMQLYENGRREIKEDLFSDRHWPSLAEVQADLAARGLRPLSEPMELIYQTLWHKHAFMNPVVELTVNEALALLVKAWDSSSRLIAMCTSGDASPLGGLSLPPEWAYDVVNEFVYLFQNFHQLRARRYALGEAGSEEYEADASLDAAVAAAWSPRDVIGLLRRAVASSGVEERMEAAASTGAQAAITAWTAPELTQLVGAFALVGLVRVETKLGDHAAAVDAARWVSLSSSGDFVPVQSAHMSLFLYLSFSLVMLGRYRDAAASASGVLLLVHRVAALLEDKAGGASNYDKATIRRLLGIVAIAEALAPGSPVDRLVLHKVRSKYEAQLAGVASVGDEAEAALSDLYGVVAPSFLDASWPPIAGALTGGEGEQVADVQRSVFLSSAQSRASELGGVRSLLRLYKTIDIPKLARLSGLDEEGVRAGLVALKLHSWRTAEAETGGAAASAGAGDALGFVVGGADGSMVETAEAVTSRDDTRDLLRVAVEMRRLVAPGRRA